MTPELLLGWACFPQCFPSRSFRGRLDRTLFLQEGRCGESDHRHDSIRKSFF
jgi:hypothetical protein